MKATHSHFKTLKKTRAKKFVGDLDKKFLKVNKTAKKKLLNIVIQLL